MKTKDIEVGGEYAYEDYPGNRYNRWRGSYYHVRVVAIEHHQRHVFSGARWDIGGHSTTQLLVHVEPIGDDKDRVVPDDGWVVPAKIVRSWAEQAEMNARDDKAQAAAEASEAERGQVVDRFRSLGYASASLSDRGVHLSGSDAAHLAAHAPSREG